MCEINSFIKQNLDPRNDDPWFVFNVEDVIQRHKKWLKLWPRVIPYYAVKVNRLPLLLEVMIAMGLKFDCASQYEMCEVLERGAKPEDIIIAHTIKNETFLRHSKKNQVDLMTFDNENELDKISSVFPEARLVLRIKVDERYSHLNLGLKFGSTLENAEKLLKRAKDLKLNVMGISFHVGSKCLSSRGYVEAIHKARTAFDMALTLGFSITLLDIGGGFPGIKLPPNHIVDHVSDFEEIARDINKSLDQLFPEKNLTIIAEPGRYYCETAFTLVTKIISKNVIETNEEKTVMYYLNDGWYGSFPYPSRNLSYKPVPLLNDYILSSRPTFLSTLWGPTCDSSDVIRKILMPEMNVGEFMLFKDIGSYSSFEHAKFGFNGMPSPTVRVYLSKYAENILCETKNWSKIKSLF